MAFFSDPHPALCTFFSVRPSNSVLLRECRHLCRQLLPTKVTLTTLRLEIDAAFWQAFEFMNGSPVTFHLPSYPQAGMCWLWCFYEVPQLLGLTPWWGNIKDHLDAMTHILNSYYRKTNCAGSLLTLYHNYILFCCVKVIKLFQSPPRISGSCWSGRNGLFSWCSTLHVSAAPFTTVNSSKDAWHLLHFWKLTWNYY